MLARNSDTVEIPKMERKRMFRLKFPLAILFSVLLAACGGSSDSVIPETGGNDDGTGGGVDAPLSANTFYPMNFYMQGGEEYDVEDGLFKGLEFYPRIQAHLIAPVNGRTLAAVTNPSLSDYQLTIAGQPVNGEHQPRLQKVLGLPVKLRTALVVDTSASMNAVDKAALVAEIKNYIAAVKASTNPTIRDQKFTLWVFASEVVPLVANFTDDATELETALDAINWIGQGDFSAVYQAIVAAVGSYAGDGTLGHSAP